MLRYGVTKKHKIAIMRMNPMPNTPPAMLELTIAVDSPKNINMA